MAFRTERLLTVIRRLICDECGEEMKKGDIALMSLPPQIEHRCAKGHRKIMSETYPAVLHVTQKEYETLLASEINNKAD